MKRRSESIVFMDVNMDMTKAKKYIEINNAKLTDPVYKFTPFIVTVAAILRVAIEKPAMNRFIAGSRLYQRNIFDICYVVKTSLDDKGKEIVVKEKFDSSDTLFDVARKINTSKDRVKTDKPQGVDAATKFLMKLPRFLIKLIFKCLDILDYYGLVPQSILQDDATYAGAFITNIGSLGIEAPFHHLFDRGTISIFIALGRLHSEKYIDENSKVATRDALNVKFSLDERISDGYYFANALQLFKNYMESPWELADEENVQSQ